MSLSGYAVLAERLHSVYSQEKGRGGYIDEASRKSPAQNFCYFTLRMEEAYCRLMSSLVDEINASIGIYKKLSLEFPNSPIVLYRLAEAYSNNDEFDKSIIELEKCISIVEDGPRIESEEIQWLYSKEHQSYLNKNLYRFAGFVFWRRYHSACKDELTGVTSDVLNDILMAWNITFKGLNRNSENSAIRKRHINNLLYYYVEFSRIADADSTLNIPDLPDRDWVDNELTEICKSTSIEESNNLKLLDTINVTAFLLGKKNLAHDAAKRVLDILEQDELAEKFPREDRDICFKNAWKTVKNAS